MAAKTATPAARAKARRDPAIRLPPRPPEADRRSALRNLHLTVRGVTYLIGPAVEGDPPMGATIDGTATLTIAVRDRDGTLQRALENEAQILADGVRVTVNGVIYVVQAVNIDDQTGTLVTLTLEDEVSWRLKQFARFWSISRKRVNRAQAALRLVREASDPPLAPMRYFIPELRDRQRIAASTPDESTSTKKGTGAASGYRVKRQRATAPQRANIDAILTEADAEGASRRVMIAAIMAATQESAITASATNGVHVGFYQQDPAYGSERTRRNATSATRGFLKEWKRIHGSVKHAPGDLAGAVERVQRSGQGSLYALWEDEATATVDRWRGSAGDSTVTVIESYQFTRGSKDGDRESSWDALARWAQDVNWRRWAETNILFYVSDNELRSAAPALEINGDEPWLLSPPGMDWSPDRPVTEITIRVLAERWGVQIGACVMVKTGPAQGRFLVSATDGYMVNPEVKVTLRRPSSKRPEPAHATHERTISSDSSGGKLLDVCEHISKQNRAYSYGGGHGPPLSKIGPHDPLDCSSSTSLALKRAGMFDGRVAIVSGQFASSWGKPGKGKEFTVWANGGHVWIEGYDEHGKPAWRFDTSPHGDGPSGPHVRRKPRNDQSRFTPRHWPAH